MVSIVVAIITSLGIVVNTIISNRTNKKIESIETIKEAFRKEINETRKENDKTYLTDFLTDVENGQVKSAIQIKRAYEIYEEYTNLNGNSYVHNKWNDLVKEGKL